MFLAVASVKGGVGKTSLSVHLAVWLRRQGHRVALLDADPQQSAARWIDRFASEADAVPYVTVEPSDDPRGATIAAAREALALGDHVVADSPPSAVDVLRVLLGVADVAVIPTGASLEELHLARRTVAMAEEESSLRRGDPVRCLVVLTRINPATTAGRDAIAVASELDSTVCATIVRHRTAWIEAASAGVPLFDLPASRAGDAIREAEAFCREATEFAHVRPA